MSTSFLMHLVGFGTALTIAFGALGIALHHNYKHKQKRDQKSA